MYFYAVEIVEKKTGGLVERYYLESSDWESAGHEAMENAEEQFAARFDKGDIILKSVILRGLVKDTTRDDLMGN